MNNAETNRATAPLAPRRSLRRKLQLLILPGVILALTAALPMHGCAASGKKPVAGAGKCSPEEQKNCTCTRSPE